MPALLLKILDAHVSHEHHVVYTVLHSASTKTSFDAYRLLGAFKLFIHNLDYHEKVQVYFWKYYHQMQRLH